MEDRTLRPTAPAWQSKPVAAGKHPIRLLVFHRKESGIMEALDKPYWKTNPQPFVCNSPVTAEVVWNTGTPAFVCDGTSHSPLTAEEAIIGGLRQIMEAIKNLLPIKPEPAPPPESKPPESFDLAGAAKFLGRSQRWLRDNCTSLGIGHERVGRKYRFTLHELERYLARHRRKGKKGVYEA